VPTISQPDDRKKIQPLISSTNDVWLRHLVVDHRVNIGEFFDRLLTALRTGQVQLPENFFEQQEQDKKVSSYSKEAG